MKLKYNLIAIAFWDLASHPAVTSWNRIRKRI